MKAQAQIFVLALAAALTASAADLAVAVPLHLFAHPAKAWHSAPAGHRWLAIADGLLESANAVDYITTRRGAFPGTGGCELNPVLTQAPCRIDVARFTAIKLVVAGFGLVQWIPVLNRLGGQSLVEALTIIDAAIAVPLAIADVNNIHVLTKTQ